MPETDQQQPAGTDQAADESATDESSVDWKAKAREWEKRAKQNHALVQELTPKATQFDALEAASKTDLERAQAQAEALQQELASTQRQALVASVALDKGLPANLARRLQGETREDLEADADELLSQFGTTSTTRAPVPDRSQGSSANGGASATPTQAFADLIKQMPG